MLVTKIPKNSPFKIPPNNCNEHHSDDVWLEVQVDPAVDDAIEITHTKVHDICFSKFVEKLLILGLERLNDGT